MNETKVEKYSKGLKTLVTKIQLLDSLIILLIGIRNAVQH
jgi:hypothetical protein